MSSVALEPAKISMMTINIKIEQPDIFLVESLEHKECDALVLNVSVLFIFNFKTVFFLTSRFVSFLE